MKIRKWIFGILIILAALLDGCQRKKELPVYRMETQEETLEILYIDDVKYLRDRNRDRDEQAYYYSRNDQYVWTLSNGIGEQIGICEEQGSYGGKFAIYEVVGDEDHTFFYMAPNGFYFGGVDGRLWMREDVSLGPPVANMVSHMELVTKESGHVLLHLEGTDMLGVLLDAYNSEFEGAEDVVMHEGEWDDGLVVLHHIEYPFLEYRFNCYYHQGQTLSVVYERRDGTRFVLPIE